MTLPLWSIIPCLWIAWAIYWKVSARNLKPILRRESLASRASHIVPLAAAVVLLVPSALPGGFLSGRILPATYLDFWTGVAMLAAGLAFTVWARVNLGSNWSGTVTVKSGHELVRTGPYAWVRHPIYTGLLLAFAGCAVARGDWRGLLALAVAFAALWRKLRIEERWLEQTFGQAYTEYRMEVPALIPSPWSTHRRRSDAR